jgi:hypothetical protein
LRYGNDKGWTRIAEWVMAAGMGFFKLMHFLRRCELRTIGSYGMVGASNFGVLYGRFLSALKHHRFTPSTLTLLSSPIKPWRESLPLRLVILVIVVIMK